MTNRAFLHLTEKKKHAKFKAVLNTKVEGSLTQEEIQEILHTVPTSRQYEIMVYHEPDDFCEGVTKSDGAEIRLILGASCIGAANQMGKLVCDMQSGIIAVTVRNRIATDEYNQLHIFIPPDRCRKEQVSL